MSIIESFRSTIAKHIAQGQYNRVVVALSGGVDSMVLLHMTQAFCQQHKIHCVSIHVHHGLNQAADKWLKFCQDYCQSHSIEFISERVVVAPKSRQSLEAVARDKRYQALVKHTLPGDLIVLGQHQTDQVETMLLQLKRGSGLDGLVGIPEYQQKFQRDWLRPLLNVSRGDIEQYAQANQVTHIEDDSNQDQRYDRNFLRHRIMPLLNERFIGFEQCAARSAQLLAEQKQILDEIAQDDLNLVCKDGSDVIDLGLLKDFSPARQAIILRFWLAGLNELKPSQKVMTQIINQGLNAREDSNVEIKLCSGVLRRFRGKLYYTLPIQPEQPQVLSQSQQQVIFHHSRLYLAEGLTPGLRLPSSQEQVNVRFGQLNTALKSHQRQVTKTVKAWLKEANIPPWQRPLIPLIYYGDQLVAIPNNIAIQVGYHANTGVNWCYELTTNHSHTAS